MPKSSLFENIYSYYHFQDLSIACSKITRHYISLIIGIECQS